jgi:light-independent protochlorophyllide reductase subunit B
VTVAAAPAAQATTGTPTTPSSPSPSTSTSTSTSTSSPAGDGAWTAEAEKELKKIPFFVRGKARRNTESFARERGLDRITLETLYDAKAHFRS